MVFVLLNILTLPILHLNVSHLTLTLLMLQSDIRFTRFYFAQVKLWLTSLANEVVLTCILLSYFELLESLRRFLITLIELLSVALWNQLLEKVHLDW